MRLQRYDLKVMYRKGKDSSFSGHTRSRTTIIALVEVQLCEYVEEMQEISQKVGVPVSDKHSEELSRASAANQVLSIGAALVYPSRLAVQ